MGAPGGSGAPGGAAPAAAAAAGTPQLPLEAARQNPFAVPEGAAVVLPKAFKTNRTTYGPDWHHYPVTLRSAFIRPQRPPVPAPGPTATEIEEIQKGAGTGFRISSILWTEGKPLAVYETPSGETGTVGPGDVVHGWKIIEIGQNYVVVQSVRNPAATQRLPLKTEK